ncbi:unnamed protein product [Amaranthus hypochondriacus]
MNQYVFNPNPPYQNFLIDHEYVVHHQSYTHNDQFGVYSSQIQPFDECQTMPYNFSSLPLLDPLDPAEVPDIPDTCFNYITNLLREEYHSSDDTSNLTLQDYMTAQMSYNKSLDAALILGENFSCSFSAHNHQYNPPVSDVLCDQSSRHCLDDYLNMFSTNSCNNMIPYPYYASAPSVIPNNYVGSNDLGSNLVGNLPLVEASDGAGLEPAPVNVIPRGGEECNHLEESSFGFIMNDDIQVGNVNLYSDAELLQDLQNPIACSLANIGDSEDPIAPICGTSGSVNDNSRRRKHDEGKGDNQEGNEGRNKQTAVGNTEVNEQIEQYGDVILCPEGRSKPGALCNNKCKAQNADDVGKKKGSKKRSKAQVVDLRGLLTRCAQCVAQVNLTSAYEVLKQIREHSSPHGDFLQRVAHYLANGLEARLEGKGLELTHDNEELSPSEVLKANRIYVASVPFMIMSYYTMNKTIAGLVSDAPSIHIIDFGIYYGLQWPCIIQNLSKRPGGPPRIRITGIDFPQRGFRPSERIEETGRCLGKYCEKYNVPFEYYPIAKKWEDVQLEELKIEGNEPLVVNCLYRAHQLFDESVEENSPRDAFLKLVRKINPDLFMHAVVNSTSSVPFFLNRFKEAMFHYSALFDIFESTMLREDNERMLLESKLYGPQALNVIACEGIERVERPEGYKQWQVRTQRAGFEQVGLDRDLLRRARAMVKRSFREEFSYDEDGHWVVQGWKGRILYAISGWKPS